MIAPNMNKPAMSFSLTHLALAALGAFAVAGAGGFYLGRTTAGGGQRAEWMAQGAGGGFGQGTDRMMGNGQGADQAPRAPRGLGMTRGEIIQLSDDDITVKLPDGGTRLVLTNESVPVTSCSVGTREQLSVGQTIMATGQADATGTVAADSLQILPASLAAPGDYMRR
jgi:hypothetical protein